MKDLFAENFWKNVVCERFWQLLFSEKHWRPPSPVANIFRKNVYSPEKFSRGALEWKGAQILEYTPPQPETGWHGPA
jgi:hypothetical protein